MTPKEKAEELFDKYRNTIVSFLSDNMKDMNAKQCALIAVDEIVKAMPNNLSSDVYIIPFNEGYWKQVKQEIEKL